MKIKTTRDLNIRFRQPNMQAPVKGMIYKGFEIEVEGQIRGQQIAGNDTWYHDKQGNFYWSGGAEIVKPPQDSQPVKPPSRTLPLILPGQILKLGYLDQKSRPESINVYLEKFHEGPILKNVMRFKKEGLNQWASLSYITGNHVENLQTTLRAAGFYNNGSLDGIFGYKTMSGLRLYQEYVRTVEGDYSIGIPDGVAGPNTYKHLNQWLDSKKTADWTVLKASKEYRRWMNMLRVFKTRNLDAPNNFLRKLNSYTGTLDTLKPHQWRYLEEDIHLIGIRRMASSVNTLENARTNDDLFILLINGVVFKFYGSTDPSRAMTSRRDEAYLMEGQHQYRFGWHKIKEQKIYRSFRPYSTGVVVRRDSNNDNALTSADKLDLQGNKTINIHWSGMGASNWSAGCQVVAGRSYINHKNQMIDCSNTSVWKYKDLGKGGKARGAYSVMLDLITVFAKKNQVLNGEKIYYTLINEEELISSDSIDTRKIEKILLKLNVK